MEYRLQCVCGWRGGGGGYGGWGEAGRGVAGWRGEGRGGGMERGEVGWRVGVLMNQLPKAVMLLCYLFSFCVITAA